VGFLAGESGHSRLELALKKYAGEGVYLRSQDHLAHEIVKFALERSADSPGYSKKQLANSSRSSVLGRRIVSVLAAIGYFGGRRPQTAAASFLWSFTKKYNSKLKHCYENAGLRRAPDELTTEEANGVRDESAGGGCHLLLWWGPCCQAGCMSSKRFQTPQILAVGMRVYKEQARTAFPDSYLHCADPQCPTGPGWAPFRSARTRHSGGTSRSSENRRCR